MNPRLEKFSYEEIGFGSSREKQLEELVRREKMHIINLPKKDLTNLQSEIQSFIHLVIYRFEAASE